MARVEISTPAPDFSMPDFQGNEIRLSGLRGRANVLLVFNRTFT